MCLIYSNNQQTNISHSTKLWYLEICRHNIVCKSEREQSVPGRDLEKHEEGGWDAIIGRGNSFVLF